MKFSDTFRRKGLSGPIREADRPEGSNPTYIHGTAEAGPPVRASDDDYEYGGMFAVRDAPTQEDRHYSSKASDNDFSRFQSRLTRGKVKLCPSCGEVMAKSSRRILSAPWGGALITLGAVLMIAYGIATNYYQLPWNIKFALPAAYYVGSIFVGIGTLFFFIRERVWICRKCKEIEKR